MGMFMLFEMAIFVAGIVAGVLFPSERVARGLSRAVGLLTVIGLALTTFVVLFSPWPAQMGGTITKYRIDRFLPQPFLLMFMVVAVVLPLAGPPTFGFVFGSGYAFRNKRRAWLESPAWIVASFVTLIGWWWMVMVASN